MAEPQELMIIDKTDLAGLVAGLRTEGYRLVQIGCSTLPGAYELTYSFDRHYQLKNLRVTIGQPEEVPSISVIYPNAFLYENEIHDLFGVVITHIAVDYAGTLYRTALETPFSIDNVKLPEPPRQKTATAEAKPTGKEASMAPGGKEATNGD